jgi:glycosyltransferase involved in cell wall biosynthesis
VTNVSSSPVQLPARDCPAGVTIAICNWNQELLLPTAIESAFKACQVLNQHGVQTEVLIIEHHSRDGSLTLVRQLEALFYEQGLRVIALTQNHKQAFGHNQALQHARYRHMVYLDADNELMPENIHVFYRAICQTGSAVVYGNLLWEGISAQEIMMINNESFQFGKLLRQNYIDTLVMVDRLQLLDAGGFLRQEEFSGPDDWELFAHLASTGRAIVFVPVVFGLYRELSQSVARDLLLQFQKDQAVLKRMYDQLNLRDQLPLNTRHLRYHPDIGYL